MGDSGQFQSSISHAYLCFCMCYSKKSPDNDFNLEAIYYLKECLYLKAAECFLKIFLVS